MPKCAPTPESIARQAEPWPAKSCQDGSVIAVSSMQRIWRSGGSPVGERSSRAGRVEGFLALDITDLFSRASFDYGVNQALTRQDYAFKPGKSQVGRAYFGIYCFHLLTKFSDVGFSILPPSEESAYLVAARAPHSPNNHQQPQYPVQRHCCVKLHEEFPVLQQL